MEIPIIRRGNDLEISVRIKDRGGNSVDWFSLSNIKAVIYSRDLRREVGSCDLGEIVEDTLLIRYSRLCRQYLGVQVLHLKFEKGGYAMTLRKPLVEFVPFSYLRANQVPDKIELEFTM